MWITLASYIARVCFMLVVGGLLTRKITPQPGGATTPSMRRYLEVLMKTLPRLEFIHFYSFLPNFFSEAGKYTEVKGFCVTITYKKVNFV